MPFKFQIKDHLRDQVTGVEGKVTVRADYITGNNRYLIEYVSKDGVLCEAWVDEDRLEQLGGEAKAPLNKREVLIYKFISGAPHRVKDIEDDGHAYFTITTLNGVPIEAYLVDQFK